MRLILLGFILLFTNCINAQSLRLHFNCHDVKIISVETNDTINRCELFLDKDETLEKLGSKFIYEYEKYGMWGPYNSYRFGKDNFSFSTDEGGIIYASFYLHSSNFKILIENNYLLKVGDNIEECLKDYKPITYSENNRKTGLVMIYYNSDANKKHSVKESYMFIGFDKESKIITEIGDFRTM